MEEITSLKQDCGTDENFVETHISKNVKITPIVQKTEETPSPDAQSAAKSSSVDAEQESRSQSSPAPNKSVSVTVRRTPTIIEKKLVSPRERYLAKVNPPSSKNPDVSKEPSKIPSHPNNINIRSSSDLSLKFSASGIVSSPTSGASNFALNSPNQPAPGGTFTTPVLPTKTKKIHVPSGSFQATRQKFQRFSSPKPCPPTSFKHDSSHST